MNYRNELTISVGLAIATGIVAVESEAQSTYQISTVESQMHQSNMRRQEEISNLFLTCELDHNVLVFNDINTFFVWDPSAVEIDEDMIEELYFGANTSTQYLLARGFDPVPSIIVISAESIENSHHEEDNDSCQQVIVGTEPSDRVQSRLGIVVGHENIHKQMAGAPMSLREIFGRDYEMSVGEDTMATISRSEFISNHTNGVSPFGFERGYPYGGFESFILNETGKSLAYLTSEYYRSVTSNNDTDWSGYFEFLEENGIDINSHFHDFSTRIFTGEIGEIPVIELEKYPFINLNTDQNIEIDLYAQNFSINIFPLYQPEPETILLNPNNIDLRISVAFMPVSSNSGELLLPENIQDVDYQSLITYLPDGTVMIDHHVFRPPFINNYRPILITTLSNTSEGSMETNGYIRRVRSDQAVEIEINKVE